MGWASDCAGPSDAVAIDMLKAERGMQGRDRRALPIQVHERLSQGIADGEFEPGSRLPSESEMAARFGVSRLTVREALHMLQRDMLIESRHGRGHFVLPVPRLIKKPISELQSVTELMEGFGYQVENVVLGVERTAARQLAETLQVEPGEPVIRLERIRTSEGEPMIYSLDVFPASLIGPAEPDWREPLLGMIESGGGPRIAYSHASIRAASLPARARRQMPSSARLPWLLLEQLGHTARHRPILYSLDYHRGDRFEFQTLRHRIEGKPT